MCSHTHPVPGKYPNTPVKFSFVSHPDHLRDIAQPLMRQMMPAGWITKTMAHQGWGADDMWWFKDGGYLSFYSRDQDPEDMAGSEKNGFGFDEPMPMEIWSEQWRRTTAPWRKVLGAMTPLGAGGEFVEMFTNSTNPNISIVQMPIWANCRCLAGLDEERLTRLGKPLSLAKEVHPEGCRCNHGFLSQSIIRSYLAGVSPQEIRAVEWGEPLFLQRRIFPEYGCDEYHTFDPDKMPEWVGTGKNRRPRDCTLWPVIDPHDERPDCVGFPVVTPTSDHYFLRELPDYEEGEWKGVHFNKITHGRMDAEKSVGLIAKVVTELDMKQEMGGWIGIDPHFGRKSYKEGGLSVVQSFNKAIEEHYPWLPRVRLVNPDKDGAKEIVAGHRIISEMFRCDKSKPLGKGNCPKMRDSIHVQNLIHATLNYRRKAASTSEGAGITDVPEEEHKDPNDYRRYHVAMKCEHIPTDVYHAPPLRHSGWAA
jgi:hypothetical protein